MINHEPSSTRRIVKRYSNRKLYDTRESRYVTLEQICQMVREGDDVVVVDNASKEDLTAVTLAQIIFEEEKRQRSMLPVAALKEIVRSGTNTEHRRVGTGPVERPSHARLAKVELLKDFLRSTEASLAVLRGVTESNTAPWSAVDRELSSLRERVERIYQTVCETFAS